MPIRKRISERQIVITDVLKERAMPLCSGPQKETILQMLAYRWVISSIAEHEEGVMVYLTTTVSDSKGRVGPDGKLHRQ